MANPRQSPAARIARIVGIVPDVLTALGCLLVWMFPFVFGKDTVKSIVLMMLVEFLLIHGTGFFSGIAFSDQRSRFGKLLSMALLSCMYGLFVAMFCFIFEAWWPVWIFAWLILSKAAWIFLNPLDRTAERQRQHITWGFSVASYLGAVFAGLMLPLPRLGLTPAVVPQLGLPGSGEWIERPHTAVAALALYYAANACFKWWLEQPAGKRIWQATH